MNLHKIGVLTVVHLILGLPGETDNMMLESVRYLNHLPIHGVPTPDKRSGLFMNRLQTKYTNTGLILFN